MLEFNFIGLISSSNQLSQYVTILFLKNRNKSTESETQNKQEIIALQKFNNIFNCINKTIFIDYEEMLQHIIRFSRRRIIENFERIICKLNSVKAM